MSHASQESLKVAKKFVKREAARSPLVNIGPTYYDGYQWVNEGGKDRRITTNGEQILSYGWWPIAHWDDEAGGCWVTTDRYQTDTWPVSGKPKYSPTTDGHIAAVHQHLRMEGYAVTHRGFNDGSRYYELWTKE